MKELSEKLRALADELDTVGAGGLGYDPNMTVAEAWRRLRAGLEGDCKLTLTVCQWSHQSKPSVEWEVWDGENRSKCAKLPGVVVMALTAVAGLDQEPEEAIDAVDAALAPEAGAIAVTSEAPVM
jgi:hypothetical protein